MISHERAIEAVEISTATYMSAVELVANVLNYLSGRDLSGKTPSGDLRDDFGREIIAAKINNEIESRLGVK